MAAADIVILIYSRGREEYLTRILNDLYRWYSASIEAAECTYRVCVYAQAYRPEFLSKLSQQFRYSWPQLLITTGGPHQCIGEVSVAAIEEADRGLRIYTEHSLFESKIVMLMDDDCVFYPDMRVNSNITAAIRSFIADNALAYSIKLGASYEFVKLPFVASCCPLMPFKEKMQWFNPRILQDYINRPDTRDLAIGEDAVLSCIAWLADPRSCYSVYGFGSFLHLPFDGYLTTEFKGVVEGGYALLFGESKERAMDASDQGKYEAGLKTGKTPHGIFPDVFVPEGHRHYNYNGVRTEIIERVENHGTTHYNGSGFDLE